MDANGIELSKLNLPQHPTPHNNNTPNIAIAIVNDIEGLAAEIEKGLEALSNIESITTKQSAELSVLMVVVHHVVTEEIPHVRKVFE